MGEITSQALWEELQKWGELPTVLNRQYVEQKLDILRARGLLENITLDQLALAFFISSIATKSTAR